MLTTEQVQIIRDHQRESIRQKTLIDKQLTLIYDNNWFNIWVPKCYAGKEMAFTDGIKLLQEMAYWDGGLSWTVTLCSGANMFAGFIDKDFAKDVFADRKVCFGGSGRCGGKAVFDGEKYHISGVWEYATGAPHLTHFTLNAFVYDAEKLRLDKEGNPVSHSFFVPRNQVLIHYDWNTFGLECTASHSFSLENVGVEAKYAFDLIPEKRKVDIPLFRIPFFTFAELTLLSNYMGMHHRFLDLVEKYFFDKSKDSTWAEKFSKSRFRLLDQFQVEQIENQKLMDQMVQQVWDKVQEESDYVLSEELTSKISKESRRMVKSIRESVITLFTLLGISAAQQEEELNIVFRNIFTASQHSLLNLTQD